MQKFRQLERCIQRIFGSFSCDTLHKISLYLIQKPIIETYILQNFQRQMEVS